MRSKAGKRTREISVIPTLESGLFGEWFGSFCYFNENAGISESARRDSAVCRLEKHRKQKINFRALSLNKHERRLRGIRLEKFLCFPDPIGIWHRDNIQLRFNRCRGIIKLVDKRKNNSFMNYRDFAISYRYLFPLFSPFLSAKGILDLFYRKDFAGTRDKTVIIFLLL